MPKYKALEENQFSSEFQLVIKKYVISYGNSQETVHQALNENLSDRFIKHLVTIQNARSTLVTNVS